MEADRSVSQSKEVHVEVSHGGISAQLEGNRWACSNPTFSAILLCVGRKSQYQWLPVEVVDRVDPSESSQSAAMTWMVLVRPGHPSVTWHSGCHDDSNSRWKAARKA